MAKMTMKAARINANLTQKQASKALKVSNKTLCNWENGICLPKADKIDAICDLYNCDYDDIDFCAKVR